jgi:HK97 family phage portal protein
MLGFGRKKEQRASIESPTVPVSSEKFLEFFGIESVATPRVTIDSALGVPAIWAVCNFLPGTLAGLPLNVFQKTKDGRKKVEGALASLLHDAINDDTTSFQWRRDKFGQVFTGGRGYTFIERDTNRLPVNLYPLTPSATRPFRKNGRKFYDYTENGTTTTYDAADVIDIPMMLRQDGIRHYSPITTNREVISLAIAITRYGAKFFSNGGVPPFALTGPFSTAGGLSAAKRDLSDKVRQVAEEGGLAIPLPDGHDLKPIGVDPEKMQMVDTQRFIIEQVARIYSLPPVFLQDLTHGTFTNTEQQDLQLTKHTIKRWVEQFEQELNLKLFGRQNKDGYYVRFNLDGLMRGDFKTRMEGLAQAVQNSLMKPNEGRALLELPDDPDGQYLMIQGATVPVRNQIAANPKTTPPAPPSGQGN